MLNILCKRSLYDFAKTPQKLLKVIPRSTYFLPAKNKIPILWIELQTRKNQNFTSKHQAVKNLQIAKTFPKNVNKEPT